MQPALCCCAPSRSHVLGFWMLYFSFICLGKNLCLCVCVCLDVFVCVPIVSGRCCSMFEDNSRSSKASQPEISASSVSMRFLAKSKYRNWRSFPNDCSREEKERKRQHKGWDEQNSGRKASCKCLHCCTECALTPGIDCRELLSSHSSLRLWICSNTSG